MRPQNKSGRRDATNTAPAKPNRKRTPRKSNMGALILSHWHYTDQARQAVTP